MESIVPIGKNLVKSEFSDLKVAKQLLCDICSNSDATKPIFLLANQEAFPTLRLVVVPFALLVTHHR